MKVTVIGHASLYIETSDQRILMDPYFDNTLIDGVLSFNPVRVLDANLLPEPTIIVVSHAHFDHFHLETLKQFRRDIPLVTANDPHILTKLKMLGFENVIACPAWHAVEMGETRLVATPSEHEEEEIGLVVENQGCRLWHMVDSEVTTETGQILAQAVGTIDLVAAKHQPSIRAMVGYMRNVGAAFDKQECLTWLEAACACNPGVVFPYASGITFQGRHEWFNRYAFPLADTEVVSLLQRRLGGADRATTVRPGDVFELEPGQKPCKVEQASPFVHTAPAPEIFWEPIDTSTLFGLEQPAERLHLKEQLEDFLSGPLALWLARHVPSENSAWSIFRHSEVVWQLVVHVGQGQRLNYSIDFRSGQFAASSGTHPEANFFTHLSGKTLAEVFEGLPGMVFWLAGSVRSYEKIISADGDRFTYPQLPENPEYHLCDPLTYYLRKFGTGALSPNEPDIPDIAVESSDQPKEVDQPEETAAVLQSSPHQASEEAPEQQDLGTDLELLARRGSNDRVLNKKALLAYLTLQEAERIGLDVTEAEIESTSESFRQFFGLVHGDATDQWMESAQLSGETYHQMMRNFTTVIKLERLYRQQVQPLLKEYQLMAAAQASLTAQ